MSNAATRPLTKWMPGRRGRTWDPSLPRWASLLLVTPLVAAVGLLVVYPLVKLVYDSLTLGEGVGNYTATVTSSAARRAMVTTILDSVAVTFCSVTAATVLAWSIKLAKRPVRVMFLWAVVLLPFWMGVVVKNYAFVLLLTQEGVVNNVLLQLGLVEEPLSLLYTPLAVVLGMIYSMMPYALLAVYPSVAMLDMDLVNAASGLGASRAKALTSVVLPLISPGIVISAAVVFAISLGFYVTPVLLGGAQTPFIASLVGDYIFNYYNYPQAAAASVLVLVLALAVLAVTIRAVGLKAFKGGLA